MSSDSWEEVRHSEVDDSASPSNQGESIRPGRPPVKTITSRNNVRDSSFLLRVRGGMTFSFILGTWVIGALCPLWLLCLAWIGGRLAYTIIAGVVAIILYPYLVGRSEAEKASSTSDVGLRFRHALASWGQHWHKSCGRIYESEGPDTWDSMPPTLFCYHPHGVFAQGYILNGGLNKELPQMVGLIATALYHAPFFRLILSKWTGATAPASRHTFLALMAEKKSFGILPGGFQEAAIAKLGRDRVWIKGRKGFIKYALQNGYRLRQIYTFGECDTFWNIQGMWKPRLWLTARSIPAVFPWGTWWCPILPRRANIMTIFGKPLELPEIKNPSREDIDRWHSAYVQELSALYDRYKNEYAANPQAELEVW